MSQTAAAQRRAPGAEQDAAAAAARTPLRAATLDDRSWARTFRVQRGWTKAAMAERLQKPDGQPYSRSAYSRWEEGDYGEDPETARHLDAAVRAYRHKEEAAGGLSKVVGFREIQPARETWQCIDLAWSGEFVLLCAEPGAGKTEAIMEARRRAMAEGKPLPIYIRATAFTSGYALVTALAGEAGLQRRGNPDALLRAIADKLHAEPRIVILDEAHQAHPKAIEALRDLWDLAGVGILLCYTTLVAGLARSTLGRTDLLSDILERRPEAEQLSRRVLVREIEGIGPDDIEAILDDVLGACTTDAREEILARTGRSTGWLVRLVDAIQRLRVAKRLTGPVDLRQVERAWQQLHRRKREPALAVSTVQRPRSADVGHRTANGRPEHRDP